MKHPESSPKYGPLQQSDDLAYFMRERRHQLRLTATDAAKLAGLRVSQWKALESGRCQEMHDSLSFSIAGTLEVSVDLIRWLVASD